MVDSIVCIIEEGGIRRRKRIKRDEKQSFSATHLFFSL